MKDLYKIPEGSVVETFEDRTSQQDSSKSTQTEVETDPSVLESFLRGGAQSASAGFAEELTAGVEGALTDKTYEQSRQEAREAYKRAKDVNPDSYLAGEIAGGLASLFVPGGALAKLGLAGKGVGGAVKAGGILGGLTGLGTSEADLTKLELGEAAKDTATGVLLGGVTGGAFGAAGKAIDAYKGSKLRELVQKGVDISDPVAAQRIANTLSEDIAGKLTATPKRLIEGRDKIVSQSLGREKFTTPKTEGVLDVIHPKAPTVEPDTAFLLGSPPPKPTSTSITPPDVKGALSKLKDDFANQPKVRGTLRDIEELLKKPDLDANEYKLLDQMLTDLRGSNLTGQKEDKLIRFATPIQEDLKKGLPKEWHEANRLYSEYLKDIIETPVLGGKSYSKVGPDKTFAEVKDSVSGLLEDVAKGDKDALFQLEEWVSRLKKFDAKSPGLVEEASGLNIDSLNKIISENSSKIKALGEYSTPLKPPDLTETASLVYKHPAIALGKYAFRNKLGTKAVGGLAKGEQVAQEAYSKSLEVLKKYTPSQLLEVADSLISNAGTSRIGQQLKTALQNNDPVKKSASIFSALQNPQARAILMPATQETPVKQE